MKDFCEKYPNAEARAILRSIMQKVTPSEFQMVRDMLEELTVLSAECARLNREIVELLDEKIDALK